MILAGEIGGTHTRLGLFRRGRDRLRCAREGTFLTGNHRSCEALLDAFLGAPRPRIRSCVLAVAGPVVGGRSRVVNLRWPVDRGRLARMLGAGNVRVINDLEAAAWGVPALTGRKTASLTPGLRARKGNAAIIAAGTGLGMALICRDGRTHRPQASEGGHQTFAPRDATEVELARFLERRHGRVSLERVISGPGLSAIYEFLIESGRGRRTRAMERRLKTATDRNAVIAEAALDRTDTTARRALDRFVSIFGAAAGDLALVSHATGGVYVAGGIAPKILPALRRGGFVRAFRDKGRLAPLMRTIPVRVILEPRVALLGAAACAAAPGRET